MEAEVARITASYQEKINVCEAALLGTQRQEQH